VIVCNSPRKFNFLTKGIWELNHEEFVATIKITIRDVDTEVVRGRVEQIFNSIGILDTTIQIEQDRNSF
jgi:Co/Zn/Cd efflux system component